MWAPGFDAARAGFPMTTGIFSARLLPLTMVNYPVRN